MHATLDAVVEDVAHEINSSRGDEIDDLEFAEIVDAEVARRVAADLVADL